MSTSNVKDERHPDFSRMMRKALQDVYDRLGLCVFCSIVWSVCLVFATAWAFGVVAPLGPVLAFVLGVALVGPMTLGLYEVAGQMALGEDVWAKDILRGARRHFAHGAVLFAANVVFLAAAGLAVYFYTTQLSGTIGKIIGLLWLYAAGMWLLGQLLCPAFIVRQGVGVLTAIKRSAVLVVDNIGYTFALAAQVGVVLMLIYVPVGLMLKPVVPLSFMIFFLILPAFVAVVAMNVYDDLMRKYD